MIVVLLALGGILSFFHYFSEKYSERVSGFHEQLISFSAGLFITQVFVFLLPEFFKGKEFLGNNIFILLVLGFSLFHVTEKFIYQHVKNKDKMMKELAEVHAAGFFVDHFIVGIALVFAFQSENILFGFAVFISLFLHTVSSSISLTHIDNYFKQNRLVNVLLSVAPLGGIIFAGLLNPEKSLYHIVFSFIIGSLLYVGIRDLLPRNREGNPGFFLLGFMASVTIMFLVGFL